MDTQTPKNQVCSIMIAFPAITDEQAIATKKQIELILASIPEARIEFRLAAISTVPYTQPK